MFLTVHHSILPTTLVVEGAEKRRRRREELTPGGDFKCLDMSPTFCPGRASGWMGITPLIITPAVSNLSLLGCTDGFASFSPPLPPPLPSPLPPSLSPPLPPRDSFPRRRSRQQVANRRLAWDRHGSSSLHTSLSRFLKEERKGGKGQCCFSYHSSHIISLNK